MTTMKQFRKNTDKVDITLTLEVIGKEELKNTIEYKGTTLDVAVAIENGLADLVKELNDQ